jgi:prepilin-type processing-associated H-X9-DG protein
MEKKRLLLFEVVVIVLIVGISAALLLFPLLAERRHEVRRVACVENLRQLSLVLNMYASENKDRFPPIDDKKNNFMFDANLLYPEYLNDPLMAMCPGDPRRDPKTNFRLISEHSTDGTPKGEVHPDCLTDDSYIYLGWAVLSDREMEALFKAYDKLSADDYDTHLIVPQGWGNAEGETIHRLSAGVDRFLVADFDARWASRTPMSSILPIMWDRPHTDPAKLSHKRSDRHLLFLDGHVEYWNSDTGIAPTMNAMARLLDERPREPIPHCE